MPSELVNSVISRPQPPRPRITRRNSVSVTPAMGASTVAGAIVRSRILKLAGIIQFSLGLSPRFLQGSLPSGSGVSLNFLVRDTLGQKLNLTHYLPSRSCPRRRIFVFSSLYPLTNPFSLL